MISLFKVFMAEEVPSMVNDVLMSGFIGQGPKVEEFEEQLKNYFNTDYLVTVNSATSGEHLALHLLRKYGLEDESEILTTSQTCTASNWPIVLNRFKIKWVDINPNTINIDYNDLARKITPSSKVIYLTHWGGYPNDLDRISDIVSNTEEKFGFRPWVIEDCAHSWGALYKGKRIGTHGNICTFSLQAIKHITSGDGGVLVLPSEDIYKRAKLLRWYGISREEKRTDFRCELPIQEIGFKFHMNDINAAIGLGNFSHLDTVVQKHKENGKWYNENLKDIPGITLLKHEEGFESSFWLYSMLVERREDFHKYMKACGVMCSQVHERNDKHPCVQEFKMFLPTLDNIIPSLTNIPVGWWVTSEDREYIKECIKKGW